VEVFPSLGLEFEAAPTGVHQEYFLKTGDVPNLGYGHSRDLGWDALAAWSCE
jgi:hypothetical protein